MFNLIETVLSLFGGRSARLGIRKTHRAVLRVEGLEDRCCPAGTWR
jgi:hypothetical protein